SRCTTSPASSGRARADSALVSVGLASCLIAGLLSQETVWLERQDDHQERDDSDVLPLTTGVRHGERGQQAEYEASQRGAVHVPDPAEDRGGERLQSGGEAECEHGVVVVQAVHERSRAGEHAAEQEGEGDDAVHVDAHLLCHLTVLSHRAHRLAHTRAPDDPREAEHERDRERQDEEVLEREANEGREAEQLTDEVVLREQVREALWRRAIGDADHDRGQEEVYRAPSLQRERGGRPDRSGFPPRFCHYVWTATWPRAP